MIGLSKPKKYTAGLARLANLAGSTGQRECRTGGRISRPKPTEPRWLFLHTCAIARPRRVYTDGYTHPDLAGQNVIKDQALEVSVFH